jgi:hypothetical protein
LANRYKLAVLGRIILRNLVIISVLVCTLLFSLLAVGAQQTKEATEKNPPVTFEELKKIIQEIDKRIAAVRERRNVLTVLDTLRALEAEYTAKGAAARSAIAARILTFAPEVGNYDEALRYADLAYGTTAMGRRASAEELKGYRPVDALNALARAAAAAQVVMINEAHHVPQHRAFALELLKKLRQDGFTHFASETLYETDTQLNARGYPTGQTGYYTIEQTEMSEHSAREFEHPLYQVVLAQGLVSRATVFQNARGEFWMQEKGRHDVTLFHPRSRPFNRAAGGRPDWLRLGGSRGPYQLPKKICGAARRCLVRARAAREGADAIPIDQLEILAERPAAILMLPAGEFIIEVQDTEGKSFTNFRIKQGRP